MTRDRLSFLYLNIGHFLDHLLTLVFATVAALALTREWGLSYAELVPYAMPGFVAFGLFSLPAGRLADRWSRHGMMIVFFIGIGLAAIAAGFAQTPLQMAGLLLVVGILAAIYHPVGLAMVVGSIGTAVAQGPGAKSNGYSSMLLAVVAAAALVPLSLSVGGGYIVPVVVAVLIGLAVYVPTGTGMAIAVNGVWGNLGVGSAALITGWFIDHGGWRSAFVVPGVLSVAVGLAYWWHVRDDLRLARSGAAAAPAQPKAAATSSSAAGMSAEARAAFVRLTAIVFFTTAVSSLVFQSTTFALPKVFDERLGGIAGSATVIGWMAFMVFAIASLAQLVVGRLLDTIGPRTVFMVAAALQLVFFAIMPGFRDWPALAIALGFMLGAFGQIPINDYMIGRMAKSEHRATVYGVRYVVSFSVLAAALPLIAWIHGNWGFDVLFRVLAVAAGLILIAVSMLPRSIPEGGAAATPARA
ncbi:MAG: MFS transporter [Hyphomicrobiaceae bacterium]